MTLLDKLYKDFINWFGWIVVDENDNYCMDLSLFKNILITIFISKDDAENWLKWYNNHNGKYFIKEVKVFKVERFGKHWIRDKHLSLEVNSENYILLDKLVNETNSENIKKEKNKFQSISNQLNELIK